MNSNCVFTKISHLQKKISLSHKELLLFIEYYQEAKEKDKKRLETMRKPTEDHYLWLNSVALGFLRCKELTGKINNNLAALLIKPIQKEISENIKILSELGGG